jgi:hypothetical protein
MDDFVKIYKDWLVKRREEGKKPISAEQRKVMTVMDNMKKREWNGLSEERRVEIVAELILDGVLPASVGKAMDIFSATVVLL